MWIGKSIQPKDYKKINQFLIPVILLITREICFPKEIMPIRKKLGAAPDH